MKNYSKKLY